MPLLPVPTLDYTDRDFDSLRVRLFAMLQQVFPDWTDQNVADFGNILVELFCHVGDVLGYYADNAAAEAFVPTATQRRSLLALGRLVGFQASTSTAAQADVTLTIDAPTAGAVVLPAGAFVSTAEVTDPARFQLLDGATIPAGGTAVDTTVEHSQNVQDVFESTSLPNQELVLQSTPYLDDSCVVSDALGLYTQVRTLLSSTATDRHFTVAVDQNDRAHLRFGNGSNGVVPTGSITVLYKVGGGSAGNVPAGSIKVVEGSYTDTLGNAVTVRCTNAAKAAGGAPRMSNARIKELIPEQVRAPVNSVAREDFEINARRLPWVARALFITRNEDPAVPENTGVLYVIPQGGGVPTTAQKAEVLHQVTVVYPCTVTFTVLVQDPLFKPVDVDAIVYFRAGYNRPTVRANITKALTAFFAVTNDDGTSNTNVDFGAKYTDSDGAPSPSIAWSDIFNAIRDVAGVRKLDAGPTGLLLNAQNADVVLASNEFPQLGTVRIFDGETGLQVS